MSFQLSPDKIYMAPVGFGPALCSIQNQDGGRYRADQLKEHVDQYTLSFAAGRDDLSAWLPEGLSLAAEQLIVRYERLTNVTWLAGRGFHRLELLLPVLRGGADGLFRLAAWESNADSILQGRDIFGRAVAYAAMEQDRTGGALRLTASNWGFCFLELEIRAGGAQGAGLLPGLLARGRRVYHHRYLPRTGERFVNSDADYLVSAPLCDPTPDPAPCTGTIRWNRPAFEEAPTQYYFLQPLAALALGPCTGGLHAEFDRFSDGYDQTILD